MVLCLGLGAGAVLAVQEALGLVAVDVASSATEDASAALLPVGMGLPATDAGESGFEIVSLGLELAGEEEMAVLVLRNVAAGTSRELSVQLAGVDAQGRAFATVPEAIPQLVGAGREVRLRMAVPAGGEVRQVRVQHWTQVAAPISVEAFREARRRAEEVDGPVIEAEPNAEELAQRLDPMPS